MLTTSAGDGLATVIDVLTGTQLTTLKNCSAQPGSTALIAGDFVVSAQVRCVCVCVRVRVARAAERYSHSSRERRREREVVEVEYYFVWESQSSQSVTEWTGVVVGGVGVVHQV